MGRNRSRSYSRSRSPAPRRRHYDDVPRSGGRERGGGSRHDNLPCGLLVRNIRRDSRPEDLRIPFEKFGPVKDVYLPRDYYSGEPRGFGFVQYMDHNDAADAKYNMDGQIVGGREISVVFAEENRKQPSEMRSRDMSRGGSWGNRRYGGQSFGFRRHFSPPPSPGRRFRARMRSRSPPARHHRSLSQTPEARSSRSRSPSREKHSNTLKKKASRSHSHSGERYPNSRGKRVSRSPTPPACFNTHGHRESPRSPQEKYPDIHDERVGRSHGQREPSPRSESQEKYSDINDETAGRSHGHRESQSHSPSQDKYSVGHRDRARSPSLP